MSRHVMLRFRAGGQLPIRLPATDAESAVIAWTDRDGLAHHFRFTGERDDKTGLDLYDEDEPQGSSRE